ncbi:hypothetical protein [Cupriavidus sp. 2SB]|uniref:hypothetical protein n=1 Tax=Cupriavidus sp. 2SB TaxID=2502199 RepID=UPI0010F8EE7E|nr:hypothetical protein [Cupriavidus sp. 2SB]
MTNHSTALPSSGPCSQRKSIVVRSKAALAAGLRGGATEAHTRLLYCQFPLSSMSSAELASFEALAGRCGAIILAGHLLRHADDVWEAS